ncbi:MAG: PfkB family carbohydrate kinase [Candidatus Nanopelagicales bacterium]
MTASAPSAALDLLVVGDVNPDVIVSGLTAAPRFDQVEQLVKTTDLVVGGSAGITAVGAARLGLRVGLCGVVGDDRFGEFMVSELGAARLDLERVNVVGKHATGVSVVLLHEEKRAILTAAGCMDQLSAADLAALPDRVARHIHVASYYLMSADFQQALPAALRRFRSVGTTVSVDTNWDPRELWQLDAVLGQTDIFLPNQAELLAISREAKVSDALLSLVPASMSVVAKLGEWGAVSRAPERAPELCSVRAAGDVGFVDSVGAGDSFNAAYLAGFLEGRESDECLKLAVAAGTLSTRGRGGTATQPAPAELEERASGLVAIDGFEETA